MEIAAVTLHPVLRYHSTMLPPKDTPEITHTSTAPQQQGGFLTGFSSLWAEEGASCSPDPGSEHGLMLPPKYNPLLWPTKGGMVPQERHVGERIPHHHPELGRPLGLLSDSSCLVGNTQCSGIKGFADDNAPGSKAESVLQQRAMPDSEEVQHQPYSPCTAQKRRWLWAPLPFHLRMPGTTKGLLTASALSAHEKPEPEQLTTRCFALWL